jgi:hypothetical protein
MERKLHFYVMKILYSLAERSHQDRSAKLLLFIHFSDRYPLKPKAQSLKPKA